MIEKMNETGIENLSNAIVLQAVKDYRKALKGLSVYGKSSASEIVDDEQLVKDLKAYKAL